jgi:hypothetical protein
MIMHGDDIAFSKTHMNKATSIPLGSVRMDDNSPVKFGKALVKI